MYSFAHMGWQLSLIHILERATSRDGNYELVSEITSGDITTFVSSKQPVGSVKYYRVRAYKDVDGVRHYSEYSSLMGHVAVLEQAKLTSVTVSEEDATKRVILWEKVPYADAVSYTHLDVYKRQLCRFALPRSCPKEQNFLDDGISGYFAWRHENRPSYCGRW